MNGKRQRTLGEKERGRGHYRRKRERERRRRNSGTKKGDRNRTELFMSFGSFFSFL
jgi:hypothetical protein